MRKPGDPMLNRAMVTLVQRTRGLRPKCAGKATDSWHRSFAEDSHVKWYPG